MKTLTSKSWIWLPLVSILLFLIFLPLSWSIDFMQNDDWNRYKTVAAFLNGDFRLLDVTATTFYTQGFIGLVFAKFFSVARLPILTLIFGCANFFLFSFIAHKFFKQNASGAILIGLVLFFNPIHFYSLFGFMTEVYLLTFCLISIYFVYRDGNQTAISSFYLKRKFLPANLFWILGFFAKQWAIVFSAAYFVKLILQKRRKLAFAQLLILLAVLGYYFFFFPRTQEMAEQKSFEPKNFTSIKYMFAHAYAYFIYLAVFSMPFILSLIIRKFSKFRIMMGVILAAMIMILFSITAYPWKDFPLYPNIFTDKGFFLNGIEGEAYTNIYAPLIHLLDEIGLLSLAIFMFILIRRHFRSVLNFESISILIGYFLIIGTPFVFDRYLLVLVPVAILFLLRINKYQFNRWILSVFLLVQTLISVDYGLEYISRHQLIWRHANKIHYEESIPRDKIIADHAWNKYYGLDSDNAVYWFRYSQRGDDENEKVAREFWSRGILTKTNLDIIRIQNR